MEDYFESSQDTRNDADSVDGDGDGSSASLLNHDADIAHKTAHWLRQHKVPLHRIHHTKPISETVKSVLQNFQSAPIPEGEPQPLCECHELCQCMYDELVGDDGTQQFVRVWVCASYNCFFAQMVYSDLSGYYDSGDQCEISHAFNACYWDTEGSLGGVIVDNTHAVDRYVTVWDMLGVWGDAFSDDFVERIHELKEREIAKTGKHEVVVYPKGSKAMPDGQEYDYFCSYRWQTGRARLHMTFCSVFAVPIVMLLMVVVYPILAVIFYFVVQRNVGNPAPEGETTMMALGYCATVNSLIPEMNYCTWFWFEIVGVLFMILLLMFAAQVLSSDRITVNDIHVSSNKQLLDIECF